MANRRAIIASAIVLVFAGCSAESPVVAPTPAAEKPRQPSYDESRYSGGDGLTRETAVVVGTASHPGGVGLEYMWLREHHPGFKRLKQSVTSRIEGKRYDILNIEIPDGRKFDVWFDITSFFP